MRYHAEFGGSAAMSPIAESSTENFTPLEDSFPGRLGHKNLIVSKLA